MVDVTLPLPGLSPIEGKEIVARFDRGRLSSDGGLLVLREIERRLEVADRLAACSNDPRDPASTMHRLAHITRFRLLMIAAGYEDANDATGRAPIRCSRWRSNGCPRVGTCVRSRPSRGWKTCRTYARLAAGRTSCPKATANQFRLFIHAGAYWLLWSLRVLMPRRSS